MDEESQVGLGAEEEGLPADPKALRAFGLGWAGVLGLWCFVARLKGWSAGPFLGAGALAALLLAAAAPGLLAPLYHPWMRLARALGRINAFVLLGLVYYAVLTPIGLLRRLSVPDPLDERPGAAPSRWRPRAPRPVEDYDRQF